ncbi:MAG: T9SS type A sorting domain-containing protein [Ignavibacteriales bacterium]|nr:T9SS type A sorting domain-containing protein [Ignavibacteriales bacterium]
MQLYNNLGNIGLGGGDKEFGYCIRCIENNSASAIDNDVSKVIPTKFSLSQNYPNPFNPETTISYKIAPLNLPKGEILQHVTLKVYDVLGREVATLVDEFKQPGNYEVAFNVKTPYMASLQSGIYFYRIQTNGYSETKKMLLLK